MVDANMLTEVAVKSIITTAKQSKSGGLSMYNYLKRELEILPITSSEYEAAIIEIAKELKI